MPSIFPRSLIFAGCLLLAGATLSQTQEEQRPDPPAPAPAPAVTPAETEDPEPIEVFTEEVVLPVVAYNLEGHFDPTVEPEDILVLEDDTPQQVQSLRRLPTNLLLLLGMNSQTNLTRNTETTRAIALRLVARLSAGDQVAVVQFGARAEVLQDWTADTEMAARAIRTRLFSGNRLRLAEGLMAATALLQDKPVGNTHVILITDGAETPGGSDSYYAEAARRFAATQATTRIISYADMTQEAVSERNGAVGFGGRGILTIDTDREMRRWYRRYGEAAQQGGQRLAALARAMGGRIMLAQSAEDALRHADEAARDLGSQYILTYTPRRPLTQTSSAGRRSVRVFARRIGLNVRSLRDYVVVTAPRQH